MSTPERAGPASQGVFGVTLIDQAQSRGRITDGFENCAYMYFFLGDFERYFHTDSPVLL